MLPPILCGIGGMLNQLIANGYAIQDVFEANQLPVILTMKSRLT